MRGLYETLVQRNGKRSRFLKAVSKEGRIDLEHLRPHFSNVNGKFSEKFPVKDFKKCYALA